MHDPFSMRPFFGYNFGDYLSHWLSLGANSKKFNLPRIFVVNWFRKVRENLRPHLWFNNITFHTISLPSFSNIISISNFSKKNVHDRQKFLGIFVWFSVVLRWFPVAWVWRERPCARLDSATMRGNGQGWQVSGRTGTCWGWNKPGGPGRACRHGAAILGAQTVLVWGGTYFLVFYPSRP